MGQTILNLADQRWVNAIVRLTTLTYAGKLKWERSTPQPEDWSIAPGYDVATTIYKTEIDDQRFILRVSSTSFAMHPIETQPRLFRQSSAPHISLRAVSKTNQKSINVPNFSILDGLADAVQVQVDQKEEDVFKVIEGVKD